MEPRDVHIVPLGAHTADLRRHLLTGPEGEQALSATEASLLAFLAARAPDVATRDELLREVWGYAPGVKTRAVHHAVTRLRRKLETPDGEARRLHAVYGQGYRLEPSGPVVGVDDEPEPLPSPLGLIGRAHELQAIDRHFRSGRLLTLQGPAGVGKTRLAEAWLERTRASGQRAFMVRCEGIHQPDALPLATARALGLPVQGRDVEDTVVSALVATGTRLLVLDNLEQLASDPLRDRVDHWLGAAPDLSILATSQVSLGLHGGLTLPIRPLDTAADGSAAHLFLARARVAQPSLESTDAVRADAHRIVSLLDGLPLAVELAAARCRVLSTSALCRRLADHLALVRDVHAAPDARHGSLHAALSWSWELLEPDLQRALAWLTVFAGAFGAEEAEAVLPEGPRPVVDQLQLLADHSLLAPRTDDGPRFALLQTVRAFASEALADRGEEPAARLAHLRWAATLGTEERIHRLRWGHADVVQHTHRHLADLEAAALAHPDHPDAVPATSAACALYAYSGPYERGLALARRLPEPSPTVVRQTAWLAHLAGEAGARDALERAYRDSADPVTGMQFVNACIRTAQATQGRPVLDALLADRTLPDHVRGRALHLSGVLSNQQGNTGEALDTYREAARLLARADDRAGQTRVEAAMGSCHTRLGRPDHAAEYLQSAIERVLWRGASADLVRLRCNLAVAHMQLGNLDPAAAALQAASAEARQVGDPRLESLALINLGALEEMRGALDAAEVAYHQTLDRLSRRPEEARILGICECYLGSFELRRGNLDAAEEHLRRAVGSVREAGDTLELGRVFQNQVELAWAQGQLDRARSLADRAVELSAGDALVAEALAWRGRIATALDTDHDAHADGLAAEQALHQASPWERIHGLTAVAALWLDLCEYERAAVAIDGGLAQARDAGHQDPWPAPQALYALQDRLERESAGRSDEV